MNKITIIASACIALTWLIIGFFYQHEEQSTKDFIDNNYGQFYEQRSSDPLLKGHLPEYDHKAIFNEIYQSHSSEYFKINDQMSSLIQLLSAMVIIGLLILFYKPESLQLPVISVNIPNTLLYLSVSIGLVYLWIQFGLTLNGGIDTRLALHHLTLQKEHINNLQVTYGYSNVNVYADNGVIDTWCSYYYGIFEKGNINDLHKALAFFGLFAIYGVFIGFIHSTCFALIGEFYHMRKAKRIYILYAFAMGMFILSGGAFVFEFFHGVYFITWVWVVVFITSWWWNSHRLTMADFSGSSNKAQ